MGTRIIIIVFFTISILEVNSIFGQQILISSANTVENTIGSIDYSIGYLFSQTIENQSNTITEGVYQYAIENILSKQPGLEPSIKIYPNPTQRFIYIDKIKNHSIHIIDLNGNTLFEKHVLNESIKIDLHSFESNFFLISITDAYGSSHSFKIIKLE